ncbi:MAG: threonylcarbamoyl-AMP synthase [Candidatus Yanofskybacteria bacterium]|nr:threonylcarbamoyl-AMP synthase [Candidatus Yanofskybacteria bacterium]
MQSTAFRASKSNIRYAPYCVQIVKVDLNKNYDDVIAEACRVLRLGGVVVYPTDTVYGLGTNACDSFAVNQIFKIKKRAYSKPLPVIARNIEWVDALAFFNAKTRKVVESIWPGAVTVVLPSRNQVSSVTTAGRSSLGVRIPDFVFTDKLLGKFGYPLTATSANISGEEATNDINKIIQRFQDSNCRPNLIIDAGILPKSKPSTVIDLTSGLPKVLRVGPSRPEQLLKLLSLNK